VVIETVDDNFVIVQGPRVRKRKCNVLHLVPIGKKNQRYKEHVAEGHRGEAYGVNGYGG